MERPVEVALFQRGELQSVRALSPRLERTAAAVAASIAAGLVVAAMVGTAVLTASIGLVVHAPTFFTSWLAVGLVVAFIAARRSGERARRYSIGSGIDADAFGPIDLDLVRRVGSGDDYDVGLVPGMTGAIEHGRAPLAVESLTRGGAIRVPLPAEAALRIEAGASTFVIRRRGDGSDPVPWLIGVRESAAGVQRHVAVAGMGIAAATVLSVFGVVPTAIALDERHCRSALGANASVWEMRDSIRAQAQRQAGSLQRCFDPLPQSCQQPGFIGIGVTVEPSGDVSGHWLAHTTYGSECAVNSCVAETVSGWFFETMPHRMNLVLPIEVTRTDDGTPHAPQTSLQEGHSMTAATGLVDLGPR